MSYDFFNLYDPQAFRWLWLAAPLIVLFVLDLRRRRRVLRIFISSSLLDDVSPYRSIQRQVVRFSLLLAALALLVTALARPRWDPEEIEVEEQGRNLLFCLDVSNSMRARDVDPDRLRASKSAIRQLVDTLPAGDQVGLLVYAGDAVVQCPLTPNFAHFLSVLNRVSYDAVTAGGTNLGRAIDKAVHEVFGRGDEVIETAQASDATAATQPALGQTVMDSERQGEAEAIFDHMIIFTDGENHEGHAREMAASASRNNISVFIVGIGSEQGATIPIERDGTTTTLRFGGEEVVTRLDSKKLASIVLDASGGVRHGGYLPAKTAAIDLREIYDQRIAPMGQRSSQRRRTIWQEKYQLFAGTGMMLLIVSSLISEQRPRNRKEARP